MMAAQGRDDPLLSVVVTLVDGGAAMRRVLDALADQVEPPAMDVIVPFDASVEADMAGLRDAYPDVTFLDLGVIEPERRIESAAGQHELYDRRRSAGLAAASGDLIAILEDRGAPRSDWAASLATMHESEYGVIGGAIECVPGDALGWAVYVCDFGRYGLPLESGPVEWVSDINVSYKRRVLEDTRPLWSERFQEPVVHWALLERGEVLYLSSACVVEHQRNPIRLAVLVRERFHWGRLFGHIRARHMTGPRRLALTLLGSAIAPALFVRHAVTQRRKGNGGRFLRAAPYVAILLVSWAAGEVLGYVTGRP